MLPYFLILFRRRVEAVLIEKIPKTYGESEVVETPYGVMSQVKRRGEGGASPLVRRIGDNFHNNFIRYISLIFLELD